MHDSLKRPVDPSVHPLVNQAYMVPTPAIAAMYSRVRQCIRRGVAGAVIYGHTRWGKTYAIRYCVRLLHLDLPRVTVLTIGMPRNPSRSEALFFGMLLEAARHGRPDSGTALQRRLRLYHKLAELVERAAGNKLIVFVDEAQRLELEHYEWLRDVQDELERRGVRMFTFLVGQPGILNRKSSFRQSVDTSQIVSRFMVDELRFDGFRTADDLKMSLAAYDTSTFQTAVTGLTRAIFCNARSTPASALRSSTSRCGMLSMLRTGARGLISRWRYRWSMSRALSRSRSSRT